MKTGKAQDVLGNTLSGLVDYARSHFAKEEGLMKVYAYPEYPVHKAAHEALARRAIELQTGFRAGESIVTSGVMKFLRDWLANSIMQVDHRYGPFLNKKGVI
jgi:hemerythrin